MSLSLFKPIKIGDLEIKNRFVQPAMDSQTTNEDHTFSDQTIAYYERRTEGGFGLQITDYMSVAKNGLGVKNQCGIWSDDFIEKHRKLTNAVHKKGGVIFAQIHHSGMMVSPKNTGLEVIGPSSMPAPNILSKVNAMTTDQCYQMVELFGDAALRAKKADFDGVEIHGAHGYLLAQFMSPYSNKRTDQFGGDHEGRFLLSKLCIENVKKKCGKNFPVSFRISVEEFLDGGTHLRNAIIFSKMAERAGADVINVSFGTGFGINAVTPRYFESGFNIENAAEIKKNVSIPTIVVGRINDPAIAEYIVESGKGDMVALGRQSLADPDFPNKVRTDRTDEIIPCVGCMQRCWYSKGCELSDKGVSCMLNPFTGKENRWSINQTTLPKKIVVVGGGAAGLQSSWIMSRRGHHVTLLEKETEFGGNLRLAAIPPHCSTFSQVIRTYLNMCKKYGVNLQTNTNVNKKMIENMRPDVVILATGAIPLVPDIPGLKENAVLAADVLEGRTIIGNSNVLILGGGLVACELANHMKLYHNTVTLIEKNEKLAVNDVKRSRDILIQELEKANVQSIVGANVVKVLKDGVVYEKNGEQNSLHGYDYIVLALGYRSFNNLEKEIKEVCKNVFVIGDASKARNAMYAIYEATKLAISI